MTTIQIKADNTAEVDLGNSQGLSITPTGGTASVHIDYKPLGSSVYVSAIKASSGIGNPFNVAATKYISKSDLESEHVRIGVRNHDVSVTY